MRIILAFFVSLFVSQLGNAQLLSWAKGNTYRSAENTLYWKNKKPYADYWQQDVYYQIKASLDDVEETISGEERLVYYNNSPHTLTKAYFHLYQNAVQPGSLVDNLYHANGVAHKFGKYEEKMLGTTIGKMEVNGTSVSFKINYTVMECELPKPLAPNDSCIFTIQFKTYFDRGSIGRRMKVYDHHGVKHFNGVHWYPRICVYDKKFTWETAQHLEHEFYGDFGAYDVELQLPNEYINEATGVLQNPGEVYPGDLRERLDIKNFRNKPLDSNPSVIVTRDGTKKSWKYHAENVHDFAWTADPSYRMAEVYWNGVQCVALAQENNAGLWQQTDSFVAFVIATYSRDFGMYAYPKMVAADAEDGMEYPMLTLDGGIYPSHRGLIAHEVGHNWFFGMLGNNETYRAALDEGFTQFLTAWCMKKATGQNLRPNNEEFSRVYNGYMQDAIDGEDATLNTHSDDFSSAIGHGGGYRHVYYKTATMLYNLQYVLGDSVFQKAMQDYVQTWKICHPYLEDFRNSITMSAKTDLNWFFDQWLETKKHCDYGIKRIKTNKNGNTEITLKRSGDMVMPLDIQLRMQNKSMLNITVPVSNYTKPGTSNTEPWIGWGALRRTHTIELHLPAKVTSAEIDPSYRLADINRMDNYWHRKYSLSLDKENGFTQDYRGGYQFMLRPDLWYAYVDGLRAGFKLSGGYAARKHVFNLYGWYQSGAGLLYSNNSKPFAFYFDYYNRFRGKGTLELGSRFVSSLQIHSAGWRKKNNNNEYGGYLKFMQRDVTPESYFPVLDPTNLEAGYLPGQQSWSNGRNFSVNLFYQRNYSESHHNGHFRLDLRTSAPWSNSEYSYARITWENKVNAGNVVQLHTRVFGQTGSGNNAPAESAIYAAGANPEEMQENKIVRDYIRYPLEDGRAARYLAMGGGLNLRGYQNYYLPHRANGQVKTFYRGSSGAAVNAELEFPAVFGFLNKPKLLGITPYLFGDAGVMAYSADGTFVNSGLLADAGAGIALQIRNWNILTPKKFRPALFAAAPLTVRFDMPFFVSSVPQGEEYLQFRWVLGVSRAF